MRLRRQELPTLLDYNYNDNIEDSSGITPAMDNNSNSKKSLGQHCNTIIFFVMKQKTSLIRFIMIMEITLIFVGGFTVKLERFSSVAAVNAVNSSARVEVDTSTSYSYNADKKCTLKTQIHKEVMTT